MPAAADQLPLYRTLNEFYAGIGFRQRTTTDDFYAFRVEDTYPDLPQFIPAYRKTFYHLALVRNLRGVQFSLNGQPHRPGQTILLAHSPEHVHSLRRRPDMGGVVLNFTEAFGRGNGPGVREEFFFFQAMHTNVLTLNETQAAALLTDFERVYAEYHSGHPYRLAATQGLLRALLYHALHQFEQAQAQLPAQTPGSHLVRRFQRLVDTRYLHLRHVADFAACLGTTPGHLSDTLRALTGRSAKSFVDARLVLEAQTMLAYSDLTIAQIADQLGFSEPGNFTRFFKKHSSQAPHSYRQQLYNLQNPPETNAALVGAAGQAAS